MDWIDVPSVTGEEGDYGDLICRALEAAGFAVERQPVAERAGGGGSRFNVLARAGRPELVFCTHLDTVPPWFGPSREGGLVRGRGACDAKGQALAMILAARRLVDAGEDRVGLLFTVGEEIDSAGARVADRELVEPWAPRWTIVGEPTGGRFIRGHKGIYKASLVAHGVAGHSSQDVGPSAVHGLVTCAHALLGADWGHDPLFGDGTLNLGRIEGGVAPNVVAASARAELLIRTVEPFEDVDARVRGLLADRVELEGAAFGYAPVAFHVPGHAAARGDDEVVAFGTDAPYLAHWGTRLLFGPGHILDAHTDHECLDMAAFERAVEEHVATARELLGSLET